MRKTKRRAILKAGAGAFGLLAWGPRAFANEDWPTRPIRMVIPFNAGGALDTLARLLAAKMSEYLGQPVVLDNRSGAGGNLGSNIVAQSSPDGYTLLCTAAGNFAINQFLYTKMPYSPERDLTGVMVMGKTTHVLVVNKDLPIHSLPDLVRYAKDNPSRMNYGSAGVGTIGQLGFESIKRRAGFSAEHITYRGSGDVLAALMAGQVQAALDVLPVYLDQIRNGAVRAIAVGASQRSASLPEIPAIGETLPGFSVFTWWAVAVPAGTPPTIVTKLNEAGNRALAAPDLREKFLALASEPGGGSVQETNQFIASETAKWRDFVGQSGIKFEN